MKEVTACPNCGATDQYRDKFGDIRCAYCDTLRLARTEEGPPRGHSLPNLYGTFTAFPSTAGTYCARSDLDMGVTALKYDPRDVWRL